ncbi:MAG: hypothetical protein WB930_05245 [Syntrophobacteraceae bacterium]
MFYISVSYVEAAMFWAGLVVGLMLGGSLGMFALALMIYAKRSQDELDEAVSVMEPTPVR